jgi:cysteine desulfurase
MLPVAYRPEELGYNRGMPPASHNIYLDHNATAPILPQVADAMARAYASGGGNPASQHWAGRKARQALEDARESIAAILGASFGSSQPDRLIFTSGGTESNNLALLGLARASPGHVIISSIEHPSIVEPAEELRRRGWIVDTLPVSSEGVVEVERLVEMLRDETQLVSLMYANNETGVLQPVRRAAELCAARGVPLHTDAVQAVGKLPVNFAILGATAFSVSAHKFHGPPGVGALLIRHHAPLSAQMHGGFQQGGIRPGTEPVALAVGMQVALEQWHQEHTSTTGRLMLLRDEFEAALRSGWPDLVINGENSERLPQTSNVSFPGLNRQALVMALDLAGVSCSTGSACASGSSEPSPTLVAMGCPAAILDGSIRFSWGQTTTPALMAEATKRILKVCNGLRDGKMGQKIPRSGRREGSILVD